MTGSLRVRRLSASAVMLKRRTRRLSRRTRGYELVVSEPGWDRSVWLRAGEVDAMMWQQLRRPVRFGCLPGGAGETGAASGPASSAVWRYLDAWYEASANATASTIHDAVELEPRTERSRPAGEFTAESQLDAAGTKEPSQREDTFPFPYVGRLVWKRFLFEVVECARQERLEISYAADPHVFSVALTVTVRGDSEAVARFAAFIKDDLYFRYAPLSGN